TPAARPPSRSSSSWRPKALCPRSPRREPGVAPQAHRPGDRTRGRCPAFSSRPSARASPAAEVGGDLAGGRLLRLLLLVAADLPLHDAAGAGGAAGGRKVAALLQQHRALHDLPEGRALRRPVRRLADDLLADLALRRARALPQG